LNPDSRLLASVSYDCTARIWDAHTGQCLHELKGPYDSPAGVTFSPDGRTLVTGGSDYVIILWDVSTGSRLHTWHIPKSYAGMDITGVTGRTQVQRMALKELGAVETGIAQ